MAFAARHLAAKTSLMQAPFPVFYNVGQRAMVQMTLPLPMSPFRPYADQIPPQPVVPVMPMQMMYGMRPMAMAPVWTTEERKWLKSAVLAQRSARGTFGPEFWEQISSQIGRMPQDCAYQWRYHIDVESQEGWTPEEDSHLVNLVMALDEFRRSKNPWSRYPMPPTRGWRDIARELPGRTDEACRRRYAFLMQNEHDVNGLTSGLLDEVQFDEQGAEERFYDEEGDSESHARAQATQDKFISLVANYVRFYHENVCKNGAESMVPPLKRQIAADVPVAPLIDVGAYLNRIAGWSKYYKHRNSGLATKLHMYGYGVVEVIEALDNADSQAPRLYVAYVPIVTQRRYARIESQLHNFDEMTAKTVGEIRSFIESYSSLPAGKKDGAAGLQSRKDDQGNVIVESYQEEAHGCALPANAAWSIDLGRHLKQQQLLEYIKLYGTLTTFLKTVAPNDFIITGDQRDQHIALANPPKSAPSAQ